MNRARLPGHDDQESQTNIGTALERQRARCPTRPRDPALATGFVCAKLPAGRRITVKGACLLRPGRVEQIHRNTWGVGQSSVSFWGIRIWVVSTAALTFGRRARPNFRITERFVRAWG